MKFINTITFTLIIFLSYINLSLANNSETSENKTVYRDLAMPLKQMDRSLQEPSIQAEKKAPSKAIVSKNKLKDEHNLPTEAPRQKKAPHRQGIVLVDSARFALKGGEQAPKERAKKMFHEALKYRLPEKLRKEVLLELAQLYETEKEGDLIKMKDIYEKYLELYPKDREAPTILFKLGSYYRRVGAYNLAIDRFYDIINMSIAISKDQLPVYKHISIKAQLEVAETYFLMEDYQKAIKLFTRMETDTLNEAEQEVINFKKSYAYYKTENYKPAQAGIESFIKQYPESSLTAESMYLLAIIYERLGQQEEAIKQVETLLMHKESPKSEHRKIWVEWKRRAANELANEFYEKGAYIDALKIYKAMLVAYETPAWQWPVLYQIGRSFEQLKKFDQAKESYETILTGKDWEKNQFDLTENLKVIKDNAQWRLEQIKWYQQTVNQIDDILNPKLPQDTEKEDPQLTSSSP